MVLTSLWVNVSDFESDFPYHEGRVRMEWVVNNRHQVSHISD